MIQPYTKKLRGLLLYRCSACCDEAPPPTAQYVGEATCVCGSSFQRDAEKGWFWSDVASKTWVWVDYLQVQRDLYEEGYLTFRLYGQHGRHFNPFSPDTDKWDQWLTGFNDAADDSTEGVGP